jgi:hypothetical protein
LIRWCIVDAAAGSASEPLDLHAVLCLSGGLHSLLSGEHIMDIIVSSYVLRDLPTWAFDSFVVRLGERLYPPTRSFYCDVGTHVELVVRACEADDIDQNLELVKQTVLARHAFVPAKKVEPEPRVASIALESPQNVHHTRRPADRTVRVPLKSCLRQDFPPGLISNPVGVSIDPASSDIFGLLCSINGGRWLNQVTTWQTWRGAPSARALCQQFVAMIFQKATNSAIVEQTAKSLSAIRDANGSAPNHGRAGG